MSMFGESVHFDVSVYYDHNLCDKALFSRFLIELGASQIYSKTSNKIKAGGGDTGINLL